MKHFLLTLHFCFILFFVEAQVSKGGQPLLLPGEFPEALSLTAVNMPPLPKAVSRSFSLFEDDKVQPLRFAHSFEVNLSPSNSGYWSRDNSGKRIWRLNIHSEGAYSINLIFNNFELAPACSLFIYNSDQSVVLGAFTNENNLPSGRLATAPVPGDHIIVEYQEPERLNNASSIEIGNVNHDYINLYSYLPIEGNRFGRSGECNPDFSCEQDELWKNAGQSVCRIIVDGTELCSGALVNNTRRDGTPYFITAAHCLRNPYSHETVIFTFNYQSPNCDNRIEGYFQQTISGSYLRSYSETIDAALLEMSEMPPPLYRPYWSGWDKVTDPSGIATTIHHPQGDVKKVARSESSPLAASFGASSLGGKPFIQDAHWHISRWDIGTTEPASSGAPLFLSDGKLIGTLSGGSAYCANPINDYFSRFNKMWDFFPETDQQFSSWLDPDNTGLMSLEGDDFYNDSKVVRLSNFLADDNADIIHLSPEGGYWSGHNSRNDRVFAEKYGPFISGMIHGLYLIPGKSHVNSNQTVNLKVWHGSEQPETLVAVRNNIPLSQLKVNSEYYWAFDEPVSISGSLWAGIELNYSTATDSFAVYQSLLNDSRSTGTAWVQNSEGDWLPLDTFIPEIFATSFWIDILVSGINIIDTSVISNKTGKLIIYPNPVIDHLNFVIDDYTGLADIEFYSLSGQRAMKTKLPFLNGRGILDRIQIKSGIYIVRIIIEERCYTGKLKIIAF